ncbi:MAG TPA: molybdopterin cofactor-binding domain-containing protein [Methylomirabilota bacterium]|nr:molybdopterin cofactor-binding domain-containing protein [Methylomirabilota bacterium]
MNAIMRQSRREFLETTGALVVGFTLAPSLTALAQDAKPAPLPGSLNANRLLDAWLRVNPNGTVTVFTGKIELGQGIATALAQIAADELDVDYPRIEMVTGDTSRTPNEGFTAGSLSMEHSGTAIRFACAEARDILLGLAADRLKTPASELRVSDGRVTGPNGATATYWELTTESTFKREATAKAKPKLPSEHKWVGRSVVRRDLAPKCTGGPAYVHDLRLPGMVFARVVRPPSPRAQLVALDEAPVRAMPGVVAIVRDGSFLAVAAEREEQAVKAMQELRKRARWKEAQDLPPAGAALFEHMRRHMTARDQVVSEKTSPAAATAVKRLEATYTRPYQCHASLGPSCAVAQMRDGQLTVWTHSQGVFPLRGDLARALDMDPKQITCIHREGAGCYGHNGADDVVLDAALVARAANGRPVKLQWMREDEFMWEPFGSAMLMKLSGALDGQGAIVDWVHEVWSHPHTTRPGGRDGVNLVAAWHLATPKQPPFPADVPQPAGGADRNAIPLYEFPSRRIVKHYLPEMPLRTSALRTLGGYANVFALESFMDELALAADADPVEFRLRHLRDPRARAVLEAAAQKAGWSPGRKGDGSRGRGVAFARYKNLACYCAVMADVVVNRRTGQVRVARAVSAVDAGQIVNPEGVINQIEGGIVQSTSWTLKEELRFDRTRVTTRSWADYPILTFNEVPAVEVVLLNQPNERFLGVGEGSQGPAAAAIANAFANATGRRIRDLPLTPDRVKSALT